jgi:DNA-binding MarR family transcriptional regulator
LLLRALNPSSEIVPSEYSSGHTDDRKYVSYVCLSTAIWQGIRVGGTKLDAQESSASPRLDDDSITTLRQVISRLARQLNKSATDAHLTPSQASVLALVVARGPVKLADLVRFEGVHPTMLSRLIAKLEAEGLIARLPDPVDLRSAIISPTKEGRAVQARIKANRARIVAAAASGLTPDQERLIAEALPALEALSEQLREPHSA